MSDLAPRSLSVGPVAEQLAVTAAADFLCQDLWGELRLQSGARFNQYTVITLQSGLPGVQFEGFTVMPSGGYGQRPEDAERLGVPMDQNVWLARTVRAELPNDGLATSQHTGSGYFWQDADGRWLADKRRITHPDLLGQMAQNQQERAGLVDAIRQVGARAVREQLGSLEPVDVTATSTDGAVCEATFSAHEVVSILDSYRNGAWRLPVLGHSFSAVLEALVMEDYPRTSGSKGIMQW